MVDLENLSSDDFLAGNFLESGMLMAASTISLVVGVRAIDVFDLAFVLHSV